MGLCEYLSCRGTGRDFKGMIPMNQNMNPIDAINFLLTLTGLRRASAALRLPGRDADLIIGASGDRLGASLAVHTSSGSMPIGPITLPRAKPKRRSRAK